MSRATFIHIDLLGRCARSFGAAIGCIGYGLFFVQSIGCSATGTASLPAGNHQASLQVRGQNEDTGFLGRFAPNKVVNSAKNAAGFGPDQRVAQSLFDEAELVFNQSATQQGKQRQKSFIAAARKYAKAASRWPDSSIEENSLFMMGESYFFADHYPKSEDAYATLVKKHPNTRHMDIVDARRFAMAQYWIKHQELNPDWILQPNLTSKDRPVFDKFGHGVRVLDRIRIDDPTGKLADDATMAAAVSHFRAGKFARADELFADLRQSFPSSEHQFQAHFLGLRCKLETYQGPQYSLKPMDDAEALLKQIFRQFPQEANEHREFLNNAWKEVRMNKALHDWEMAKYYDRRKNYAAARHYYQKVRDTYNDTSLSKEAADRMQALSGLPDKPGQRLPWLAKMFPTPEREKPLVARNPLENLRR